MLPRPAPTAPTAYYPALTGLRAVAAFMVFGFHHAGSGLLGSRMVGTAFLPLVLSELNTGVSIFFTLSGYLIAKRYAHRALGPAGWRRYLVHRAARILPVYWLLALLSIGLHFLKPASHALWGSWRLYVLNLTLLKGFAARWYLSGLGQSWSLTVEECFYLLAPLLFWLARRWGARWAWLSAAALLLGLGLGIYGCWPWLGPVTFMLKATIFGRAVEFLVGAAFAWAPLPAWLRKRATDSGAAGFLLVLALLVLLHGRYHRNTLDIFPGIFCHTWLLPMATGCLLAGLATEPTWLARWLGTPPWQHLGRASYCFYLLHEGVVPDTLHARLPAGLPPGAAAALTFGAILLASLLLHRCFEQPAYRWLVAYFSPAPPVVARSFASGG